MRATPFGSTQTMKSADVNDEDFKLFSHENAEKFGFISKLQAEDQNGICLAETNYPGVALYTSNPLSSEPNEGVGALVQIIPTSDNYVYSKITKVRGTEVSIEMIFKSKSKDFSSSVKFMLGNFCHDKTLFTITGEDKTTLVERIIDGRSYTQLSGTPEGKELLLADSGLDTSCVSDMTKQPASGIKYNISIARMSEDPAAYLRTFGDRDIVHLNTLNTTTPSALSPSRLLSVDPWQQLHPDINETTGKMTGDMTGFCSSLMTDGPGGAEVIGRDLSTDGPGEAVTEGPMPSLQRECVLSLSFVHLAPTRGLRLLNCFRPGKAYRVV